MNTRKSKPKQQHKQLIC